eukprot:3104417-Pyramimonas_sp.AAC.1
MALMAVILMMVIMVVRIMMTAVPTVMTTTTMMLTRPCFPRRVLCQCGSMRPTCHLATPNAQTN